MKVLIDECLDHKIRFILPGHDAVSVEWAGLKGVRNGELLRRANLSFDALVTADQGLPYEQDLKGLNLIVVVLQLGTTQAKKLQPYIHEIVRALEAAQPGTVSIVSKPQRGQ